MQNWEYYVTYLEKKELAELWNEEINGLGKDGWEMFSVQVLGDVFHLFFKRPLEQPAK